MDTVELINKALSDVDIQRILVGDANIIKYSELGNLYDTDQMLTDEKDYCIMSFTRPDPIEGTGQPYLSTTVSTSTLTRTASSQIATDS